MEATIVDSGYHSMLEETANNIDLYVADSNDTITTDDDDDDGSGAATINAELLDKLDELSDATARSIKNHSYTSFSTLYGDNDFNEGRDEMSGDIETAQDANDPPSFYHVRDMNVKPVKMQRRLVDPPSQYVCEDMREFSAVDENPIAHKAAIAKPTNGTITAGPTSATSIVYSDYATDCY